MSDGTNVTNGFEQPISKNFNKWLHCICIVNFDLEIGQALEV